MGTRLSAASTEQLRREIGAMLFFAMPPKSASEQERITRYQRQVRPLLGLIDIIEGTAPPEVDICEGCERTLRPDDPRHNGEDCVLCTNCTPEGYTASDFGYRAVDADRDIANARLFAVEMQP